MRIIARPMLVGFMKKHADTGQSLSAWYHEAKKARWENWSDIKKIYPSASILKNGRVVFNICGNKYRLIVAIHYTSRIVFIRFVGTHQAYAMINAETI